jgi:hypothetical protein
MWLMLRKDQSRVSGAELWAPTSEDFGAMGHWPKGRLLDTGGPSLTLVQR